MHAPPPKDMKRSGPADGPGGTHFADIHMLSDTEMDLTKGNANWPSGDVKDCNAEVLEDSGVFTRSPSASQTPAPLTGASHCVLSAAKGSPDKSGPKTAAHSSGSITGHDPLSKRKLLFVQGEMGSWHRKRQCVTSTGQREQES